MRCFISIKLPEHVSSKIFHAFEILEKKNLFSGSITKKENLHLTLKFLGEISEEEVKNIEKILSEINLNKFQCELSNPSFFKNENFIKIIWIDLLSEGNKIENLQEEISKKLFTFSEKNKFVPHITTARVKIILDRKFKENLIKEVNKMKFKDLKFEVDKFYLMKSQLFPSGPEYKMIKEFDLK